MNKYLIEINMMFEICYLIFIIIVWEIGNIVYFFNLCYFIIKVKVVYRNYIVRV